MNQKQRDVLCGMLKKKADKLARKLDDNFCLCSEREYSIRHTLLSNVDSREQLTGQQRKYLKGLETRWEKIEQMKKLVDNDWRKLSDEIMENVQQTRKAKTGAVHKLSLALDKAILQVQFAEDAEQAKNIIESLPTVEQLMDK